MCIFLGVYDLQLIFIHAYNKISRYIREIEREIENKKQGSFTNNTQSSAIL